MRRTMLYGINLNGDFDFKELYKLCKISDCYDYIFVGENINFKHSFTVLPFIAENTEKAKIATGIISPIINRCMQIKQAFRTLLEFYGDRFLITLAMGDRNGLAYLGIKPKNVIGTIKRCFYEIKNYKFTKNIEIFIGASAPKMIRESAKFADGVLLNYANPEYLRWALKFLDNRKIKVGCYAPALVSRNEDHVRKLVYASAIVIRGANNIFLEEFGIKKISDEIKKDFSRAYKYRDFLLENFAIGSSIDEIIDKIKEYRKIGIDICVFASPIYYNYSGLKELTEILGLC